MLRFEQTTRGECNELLVSPDNDLFLQRRRGETLPAQLVERVEVVVAESGGAERRDCFSKRLGKILAPRAQPAS